MSEKDHEKIDSLFTGYLDGELNEPHYALPPIDGFIQSVPDEGAHGCDGEGDRAEGLGLRRHGRQGEAHRREGRAEADRTGDERDDDRAFEPRVVRSLGEEAVRIEEQIGEHTHASRHAHL